MPIERPFDKPKEEGNRERPFDKLREEGNSKKTERKRRGSTDICRKCEGRQTGKKGRPKARKDSLDHRISGLVSEEELGLASNNHNENRLTEK